MSVATPVRSWGWEDVLGIPGHKLQAECGRKQSGCPLLRQPTLGRLELI